MLSLFSPRVTPLPRKKTPCALSLIRYGHPSAKNCRAAYLLTGRNGWYFRPYTVVLHGGGDGGDSSIKGKSFP